MKEVIFENYKSMTKSQRKRILFINIEDLSQPEVIEKII